jgi:hypothetical protein
MSKMSTKKCPYKKPARFELCEYRQTNIQTNKQTLLLYIYRLMITTNTKYARRAANTRAANTQAANTRAANTRAANTRVADKPAEGWLPSYHLVSL